MRPLPEVEIGPEIEDYPPLTRPETCERSAKPGVIIFRDFVLDHLGGGDFGIERDCKGKPPTSDHNEGRAWDWRVNVNNPEDVERVDYLLGWLLATDKYGNAHALFRRWGLRYIIWDNRRFGWSQDGFQWQDYHGWSPHEDHVHLSFGWPGARGETSMFRWLEDPPRPEPWQPPPSPSPGPWGPLVAVGAAALTYLALRRASRRQPRG